ncbi:AraC-type DNA-binding protein [Mucilaginibacter pineti]|uniref:AraC-type DNA-binding protein n=1 Tax=Mucilaginibacter pineti TaxID=1391627 RepID=A0A1G6ZJ14_9SPHI|nr:AraC family transcriptional regulator [Mucilaginibacter pineti]SDE02412.1 AraC-type DNA-binding protein [Mucilaginibacter pineti]
MKTSEFPTVRCLTSSQNVPGGVSIISYNSEAVSINAKVNLTQNLFSFLLEGQKSVHYAGRRVVISPNQFLLMSSGNCLMSEKIAAPSGRYKSLLFFFDDKLLTDFFTRHPQAVQALAKKGEEEPFLVFEKDAFLVNFIESLGYMLSSGHPLSAELQQVKLEELLVYLSQYYPEQIRRLRNSSYQVDDGLLIRSAVTANIDNAVTVEELAFLCHMSISTFKRRFAKLYGTSPNKWLLEKRMQKAAHLLKQGEYKASEIYFQLGYENLSSFIHSFKRVHGITPKQFQLLN